MAKVYIDDSKPFPYFPAEPNNRCEGFADFCKRQKAGLNLVSNEMEQENREQAEMQELLKKRCERRYALFYDNLDLILRHRDEIRGTPRYANIDAHYLVRGGGLYVGPLATARRYNFAGTLVNIDLRLSTLLEIWDNDPFKVECKCGGTAVIRSFSGSPLSGGSQATAVCPCCKKQIHVGNRSFGKYYGLLRIMIDREVEMGARNFVARWTHAEAKYERRVAEGENAKWNKAGSELHGDGEPCSLETMINELRLKEFKTLPKEGR